MKRWIVAAVLALVGLCGLYVGGAVFWNWFGHARGAGEIQGASIPAAVIDARDGVVASAAGGDSKRILFGDLHVHTTYSTDAFLWALPMFGGEGVHPLADACDFARYCSQLDFFAATDHAEAITPVRWEETKTSIRQCNARSGDPANPDMVSFVGFEWTQVGRTPNDHYGHKNVIFPGLEDGGIAQRAIAAAGVATQALRGSPAALNRWIPFLDWKHRQDYFDFQKYIKETRDPVDCDASKPSNELSRDCFESATTPGDLVRKLDEQRLRYLLIPHGTSWGFYTPPGTTFDKQLEASMRPERQTLIEVMSGHGNSEEYRSWREIDTQDGVTGECPAPTDDYEPSCWRAGEIIRARCVAAGETAESCETRAADVRHQAANLGVAYHLLVSGEKVEDWLDSGQCRDCFVPPFSHRPRTSVQYGLAIRNFDDPANPTAFRWGFIGSSDNHRARPGTGFKPVDRLRHTEASGVNSDEWRTRMLGPPEPQTASSTGMTQQDLQTLAGFQLTEVERQASFFTTGAIAAVHSEGRSREQIYAALERREVFATSGPRMLLWFDLINAPGATAGATVPMGGEATMNAPPRFRVRAVGDFVQKPGCPSFTEQGLPENRLRALCGGECYNPGDARHKITRIEVVRIRPQVRAGEAVDGLIEDVWRTLPCNDTGAGCTAEFGDTDFARGGRDALYYVRAIQEPTPRVNGGGLRATRDANGRTTAVEPCWGDWRTSRSDNCVANVEERAWSSPIYVSAARR
ncbi:MAG: DUF3604 domain-containing protein [Hyphomonadaceae bacterium]|nr:MAG: hypothetical protein FD160_2304 [Caulobacteraceae bacterium]MBT9447833.1 DUF3604 domain-containing protein [Hyphomonadaceae bacterium]TPW07511.1 MAG: hypothetical protein FD124_1088 [Alphaproteobacteria bacterium]